MGDSVADRMIQQREVVRLIKQLKERRKINCDLIQHTYSFKSKKYPLSRSRQSSIDSWSTKNKAIDAEMKRLWTLWHKAKTEDAGEIKISEDIIPVSPFDEEFL